MAIQKLPGGTRGAGSAPGMVARIVTPVMIRVHKLSHDRFSGLDLLYLRTVGARSGQTRTAPVARFDDGSGGWLVVASGGGSKQHPGWYHNIAAHPDDVTVEVGGVRHKVRVEQLDGEARDAAWQQIVGRAPRFGGYQTKTDRSIPVLRLTPVS